MRGGNWSIVAEISISLPSLSRSGIKPDTTPTSQWGLVMWGDPPTRILSRRCPANHHRGSDLAVSRWIEAATGWSIRRFVKTALRYRTIQIQAGDHTITAADPLLAELRQAIEAISAGL